MQQLQTIIETAFEHRTEITPNSVDAVTRDAINQSINLLDSGKMRVAEKINGNWVTHQWLKKRYCYHSALTKISLLMVAKLIIMIKCH